MMNVLLLGGGLQGLSFGESLYKKRDYCVDAISDREDIKRSRFFRKVYPISKADYNVWLEKILTTENYDIIVPMGDAGASFLSKHKYEIEKVYHVKCAIEDEKSLSIVADKGAFMEFCKKNDVPHPLTVSLSETNLEIAADEVGFPSLIKPDHSVGARGITKVHSKQELKSYYPKICEKYGACTLQEFIDNPDYYYNVMLYRDSKGNCGHSVVIKIVRMYPVMAGSSSCCISVEKPDLVEICKKVLEKLNWSGMADFDVLQRKDTLAYKIIEINPRVPASLRAAYISGINFPEMIVRDMLGDTVFNYKYEPQKTLRYMGIDLLWFLKSPNRFKSYPSWFHFFGGNVFYQDIIGRDPSTWYTWFMSGFLKLFHS